MWDPYAEFKTAELPNGLTVLALPMKREWQYIGFVVHSGAAQDPAGLEGTAHFVEHLVSENARIPEKELSAFFDGYGGRAMLGEIGYHSTVYWIQTPADETILAEALGLFGSMLIEAELKKCIERERRVIISEFRKAHPLKADIELLRSERQVLYPGTWVERCLIPGGIPESIRQITDVHLQEFYDTHYTPANISVVGVGAVKLDDLTGLLLKSPFGARKKGKRTKPQLSLASFASPQDYRRTSARKSLETASYYSVGRFPGNTNPYAILLLQEILTDTVSDAVRKSNGFAYEIEVPYNYFGCAHELSIDCRGLDPEEIESAESVIEYAIGVSGSQEGVFEESKKRMLASSTMLDESGQDICEVVLEDLGEHQRIVTLTEERNGFAAATLTEIGNLLQTFGPKERWTLIMRP